MSTEDDDMDFDFGALGGSIGVVEDDGDDCGPTLANLTQKDIKALGAFAMPDAIDLDAVKPKPMPVVRKKEWSEQQKAVFAMMKNKDSGHVTIIARAGSAKTTTSIEGGKYAPERSILYAAFGKDIAKELESKLPGNHCKAKTTHSLGFSIIRAHRPNCKIEKSCAYPRIARAVTDYFEIPENKWDDEGLLYCRENEWHLAKLLELVKIMAPHTDTEEEVMDVALNMNLATTKPRETWPHVKGFKRPDPKLQFTDPDGYEWQMAEYRHETQHLVPKFIQHVCRIIVMVLDAQVKQLIHSNAKTEILVDFSDMIWIPVRLLWVVPQYPLVIIDEAQDLSFTQIELAIGVCKGRIFLIGDDRQAIYGWRGADSKSLSRMTRQLKSTVLHLQTCYRCAKSIVREAQRYVPDIMPWEHSPEGEVHRKVLYSTMLDTVKEGDFVLCRSNAPLMAICLRLIIMGKRAKMGGADIGLRLLKILDTVEGKGGQKEAFKNNEDMWNRLLIWGQSERASIEEMVRRKYTGAKEDKIEAEIESRLEVLRDELGVFNVMMKQLETPRAVRRKIEALFEQGEDGDTGVDRSRYVLCASVHKSKGLESKNVFILEDYLKKKNEEELNICYVAITRAQEKLYYVTKYADNDDEEHEDQSKISHHWATARPELNQLEAASA